MAVKLTRQQIIERCIEKHSDSFDYSLFEVNKLSDKSIIIHNLCGNKFVQEAKAHLDTRRKSGDGCPHCAGKKKTKVDFINSAKLKFNNLYDYSNFSFINYSTKGIIKCNQCNHIFKQTANGHVTNGYGCPSCAGKLRDKKQFVELANKKHNNFYDYTHFSYKNSDLKSIIICPLHGEFKQSAKLHLSGRGCIKCKYASQASKQKMTEHDYISKANEIHDNKYEYDYSTYINNKHPITIICKLHGKFNQIAGNHLLLKHGCPKCSANVSKKEIEVREFIRSIYKNKIITNSKSIIDNYELDIYLPDINFAVEYNGLYWHCENKKIDKNYHLNKTLNCDKKGINLFHLFEDDWINRNEIVKSMLRNLIFSTPTKVYARKCIIKNVDSTLAKAFLNENHLQGGVNSKIKLGLYYNDELVSLMTFGSYRISLGQKAIDDHYELIRFCNKRNTLVMGASSKLFKYFITHHTPTQIVSYADYSWSKGHMYNVLGFTLVGRSKPNYKYIIGNERHYRYPYRKSELIKQGFDKNKSEHQIMLDRGIYRIYDCGTLKYIWKNKKDDE